MNVSLNFSILVLRSFQRSIYINLIIIDWFKYSIYLSDENV